jgi:hypothetical protein
LQWNVPIDGGSARSIDSQVDKLLRDLGYPPPPLRLEHVRELLRLDLRYYSSADDGWLREKVHQLRVAGKQILSRPTLLLDVVRKVGLKGLLLPDQRRVLIDSELPPPKQRWSEAHEVVHDLLPWHRGAALGDPEHTLHPSCHETIEAEANYGAGQLLFMGGRFREELRASPLNFGRVRKLAGVFGNTMTTTLWRCVEQCDLPAAGLVSQHPALPLTPNTHPVRYFLRSPTFLHAFSSRSPEELFAIASGYCRRGRGPLGELETVLVDDAGQKHVFRFETFFNHHDALTVVLYQGLKPCMA